MRLLLILESLVDSAYDLKYYHKLQGFVYNQLKDTPYCSVHNKKGAKYFCFSNIFPIGDMRCGDTRKLLISSPDPVLIKTLQKKIEAVEKVNIGDMSFRLKESKIVNSRILSKSKIRCSTPIVLRIPQNKYAKYGITEEKQDEYWKPKYPLECFVKQLEENMIKKYNEFHGTKMDEFAIFEKFRFVKPSVNHVVIDNKERILVGSIWEFDFSILDQRKKELLQFALDCGFGERNTYGFGFVNVMK